jgi:hypothetical protein
MAAGTITNWEIYQDQFNAGAAEKLHENINAFNGASNNCIRLTAEESRGAYFEEAFFDLNSSLITHRDPTSVSAATDSLLTQDSIISPKITRRIGPIAQTLNSLRKTGLTEQQYSFVFGEMVGDAIAKDYLESSIDALVAAIGVDSAIVNGTEAVPVAKTHAQLVTTMALMGDMADNVSCWVMHSSVYYALVGQAITDNIWDVGGIAIKGATTPTLGRPTIVTDNTSMFTTGGATTDPLYHVLGLVPNAMHIKESEGRTMVSETITGLENLQVRFQGEHAYNMTMRGTTWDQASGGNYPSVAAVATGTNWDRVVSDAKGGPGVMMQVA